MTLNTGDIKNEAGTTTVAANSQYLGIRFASGLPAKPNSWGNFSGWIQGNNGSLLFHATAHHESSGSLFPTG